jgi:Ca2+/H+ antiporter
VAAVCALGTVGALAGANFQSVFMHAALGYAPNNELFHVPDIRQSIALILAIPVALTIAAAVLARLRRLSYLLTLSKLACAASCLLVGVYAVLMLATVRQDRVLNQQVTRETLDVQDYYADVAGKPWPAHTDWSSLDFH